MEVNENYLFSTSTLDKTAPTSPDFGVQENNRTMIHNNIVDGKTVQSKNSMTSLNLHNDSFVASRSKTPVNHFFGSVKSLVLSPKSPELSVKDNNRTIIHANNDPGKIQPNNSRNDGSFVASSNENNKFVGPIDSVLPLKKKRIHIIEQIFFMPKEIQTDLSLNDIDLLFKYYQEAVDERNQLLTRISTMIIEVDYFKGNDKKSRFYTGLTTWSLLESFVELVKDFLPSHFNCKLNRFQMVVLTLIKLRLNLTFTDIGYRFQIDETTAARYFYRCLYIFHKIFSNTKLVHWPEERENLLHNTPSYFRSTFKEQVTIIVDCFEIFCESPTEFRALAQGFSTYKHHETLKFLIGITTTGVIIFISIAFGGRSSDKEIVKKSGFLDKLQEGDLVLADKGFLVKNEVEDKQASLRIPCFVRNGNQLHPTEVEVSRNYSRIRIHVERLINVLRRKFNICSDTARMSYIAKENDLFERDMYDKILLVCSALVNICPSVVKTDFEI